MLISASAISLTMRASIDSDKRRDAFSFGSRLAAPVSLATRCSFRALARIPDSIGDQRRRDEHLAVVVVERARDRPASLPKGLTWNAS